MGIPAVVTAGDRGAAKAVCGDSKVFLEVGGLPLVAHAVLALQDVSEVSAVWVVGDAERLERLFARPELRSRLTKTLHVLAQFANLYENAWESYRRLLPGAGPDGRDPFPDEEVEERPHRDGAQRPRLQPDPGHEHPGYRAADHRDEGRIAAPSRPISPISGKDCSQSPNPALGRAVGR